MRLIQLVLITILLVVSRTEGVAAEGARAEVRAILVVASNQNAKSDARLAPYEPNLRRILRFESFRFVAEGSSALAMPGSATISLGGGQVLEIETEKADGRGGVHLRVHWRDGDRTLMNTAMVLRRGVPAVLGGPSAGKEGEVSAIIVVAD